MNINSRRFYEHFQEKPDNQDMIPWFYHRCNKLIEHKLDLAEAEKEQSEELENIVDKEFDSLYESYSTNTEGKKVPYEELEGMKSDETEQMYQADEILTGAISDEQIDNIYLSLNRKEINRLVQKELAKLPFKKRDVIDLYLLEQMSEEEIAKIKDIQINTVKKYVNEGLGYLRDKLISLV